MQLKAGSTLQDGKYRIIRVLGQGGFGITYLAENTFFEKKVAIKEFFPKDYCGRDNTSHLTLGTQNTAETVTRLRDRFIKEARNIARLDHPGIVRIHDIFEENNTAYYVMEYIEGESLHEMVKRLGSLPEGNAIEYVKEVGEALEYIHSRNMTHFDVKPANIVVRSSDNMPILIDFGLSKQYDSQGDATSTLMQAVSHGYAPMEQYNNNGVTSFSPQTDVYSLAATLLYLLTGNQPPQASVIIEDGLNIPEYVDPRVADAIRKGMAPSRKNRYATVRDFVGALPDIKPVDLNSWINESTHLFNDNAECEQLRNRVGELEQIIENQEAQVRRLQSELDYRIAHTAEGSSSLSKWKMAIGALAVGFIISLIFNLVQSSENSGLSAQSEHFRDQVNELAMALDERNTLLQRITKDNDVFISDIEVRNDGELYEDKIYSKNTTYINPRFLAVNLSDKNKVVGVKFYSPSGLTTGTGSADGFSYTDSIPANTGLSGNEWVEIVGWGNSEKGKWGPGKYRFEFWVDGKCIGSRPFTIYN